MPTIKRHIAGASFAWVLLFCLIPLASFNCWEGFTGLLTPSAYYHKGFKDLHRRWVEEECVREGKSPNAVMDGRLPPPAAGTPEDADYPPWALVMGLAFTVHNWHTTLFLFATWSAAACALMTWWGYRTGIAYSTVCGLVLAAGVLAIGADRSSLDVGQYTLIVCGLLVLTLLLDERGFHWLAGIALGLSLIKFSISLPFCLCFLVVGRWKTLTSAGLCVVLTSLWSWHVIHVPPWTAFQQAAAVGAVFATSSPTPLKELVHLGVSPGLATWVVAVVVAGAGAALMWSRRHRSMLTLFAIACVTARLWTYHLFYDDPMMIFLLVALGEQVITAKTPRASSSSQWAFVAVGLSLWLTFGHLPRWWFVIIETGVWTVGLYYLLREEQPVTRELAIEMDVPELVDGLLV